MRTSKLATQLCDLETVFKAYSTRGMVTLKPSKHEGLSLDMSAALTFCFAEIWGSAKDVLHVQFLDIEINKYNFDNLFYFSFSSPSFFFFFRIEVGFIFSVNHQQYDVILIRFNKMQQYAGIYLLQNHSLHVSGVHRTHHQENIKV